MKLILANNQTEQFTSFYDDVKSQSKIPFDYAGYESLVFFFNTDAARPVMVISTSTGRSLTEYDGVYLNGYLHTYELAAALAICCRSLGVPFVNSEFANPPSLSKLTGGAKLAAAQVSTPPTVAGSKTALLAAQNHIADTLQFPIVLKRADADRGLDNFKLDSVDELHDVLAPYPDRSIWIAQEFIPNNGFYLVSCYDQQPAFCVFRSLQPRPDGNPRKAHMYKPKGGSNAQLLPLGDVPPEILTAATTGMKAMDRQIGSVDCLHDPMTGRAYVLEVNFNPQLVTVSTFRDTHVAAFLEGLSTIR